ncbi:cytochrome c biogenesis CcdA family protein [Metabacillus fastidiosus]|uniref:cytochrome c biogenesis CcdA family protein n=1 Tax=Metabacillus fastidiosus TaxID=1458 RepID=UPI002DB79B44|nr:cytochrome c biogenesis CcdA family protein [Metabacillus fastidiosus]MEC2075287.1 cytochrome c biogenesis CcdA family protein [Metabacillus fastidiosus]MED4533044.1 cytochrome c biogenesis CcdA family protein [Metabacillus fastidiosus]
MENVTFLLAFSAGLLAFISPCCLPLYPSFVSYITGMSVNELKGEKTNTHRKKILLHAVFFSIGFSIIYYILGFSFSKVGSFFTNYQDLIRMLGGIFIVFMGLFMLEIIQPKFMLKEIRLQQKKRNVGYINSLLIGLGFAAGWTPCLGPIFGTIMYASALNPSQAFINITGYSLGFCIPFILMAFFISKTRFILKYSRTLMKIGGIIMIIFGILLYFDKMIIFSIWFSELQYRFNDFFNINL